MGRPALDALLDEIDLPAPDWSRLGGQFAALVRKSGRTFLLSDYFAVFQLFHDPDMRIFSTSLLSAAAALPRLSFDPQGVYEFAFNVVPVGNDTVFAELKTLGPDRLVELGERRRDRPPVAKPLPAAAEAMAIGERIERHREPARPRRSAATSHFSATEVFCPLSGGLDSRLAARRPARRGLPSARLRLRARRTATTSASRARSARPRDSRSNGSTRKQRALDPDAFRRAGRAQFPRL